MTPSHCVFISDIHLNPRAPHTTELFIHWCEEQALAADAVYILGDFFDAWIGDDEDNAFTRCIKQALRKLIEQGIPVYFLVGNHDFLVGKTFCEQTGITWMADPSRVSIYGTPVLLTHGDFMCTDDKRHIAFRRFGNRRFWRWLYSCLPITWRRGIANKIQQKSQYHINEKNHHILDVNKKSVRQWFAKHQVQHMIHGHTHKPAIHEIKLEEKTTAYRYVLGCWYFNAEVLYWFKDGTQKIVSVLPEDERKQPS